MFNLTTTGKRREETVMDVVDRMEQNTRVLPRLNRVYVRNCITFKTYLKRIDKHHRLAVSLAKRLEQAYIKKTFSLNYISDAIIIYLLIHIYSRF